MHLLQALRQLQAIDREWDEKGLLYRSVRQRLSDQSELEAKRKAQHRRVEELSALRGQLHDLELKLSGLQEKAKQVETDLYSGRITSPRELENLRQDSDYLKKRVSGLEDQALMIMTEVDDLEVATQHGEEALRTFETQWAQDHESLIAQYKDSRARLQQLQSSREQLRATLERADLALYDELRDRKGGIALAPAKNGLCQTCRVTVPSYKAKLVEAGETAETCEGCGRILYPS